MEKEDSKSVKKLSPFDIIDYIFTNDAEFSKVSDIVLAQNYFIINRTFAIKYPLQAAAFSEMRMNEAEAVKAWKQFLSMKEKLGKVPFWCYAKGAKKSQESNDKDIKKADLAEYAKYACISLKDAEDLAMFAKEELLSEIDRIKKLHSIKEQEKQIKTSKS